MWFVFITLLASSQALHIAIPHTKTSNGTSFLLKEQATTTKDFEEFKKVLRGLEPYVMLRDYKKLNNQLNSKDVTTTHIPSKVLVGEDSKFKSPKHPFDGKKLNTVKYKFKGGHQAEIGFSKVGDHYYDPNWGADMLERREKNEDGLWVLSDEDQFYSILYHSLVRWPGAGDQAHKPTLAHLAPKIGVEYDSNGHNNNKQMKKTLQDFMTAHNYTFTDPFHKKPGTPTKYMKLDAIPSRQDNPLHPIQSAGQPTASLGKTSKPKCKTTHFIHIGKTGGSTVKAWLMEAYPGMRERHDDKYLKKKRGNSVKLSRWDFNESQFLLHGHGFRLGDGGPEDCYVTFVRDPVERWVSGFLSRARGASNGGKKEKAHLDLGEKKIYAHYPTPETLAQALGSQNSGKRAEALKANNGLHHTKEGMAWYLRNIDTYMDRILFVGEVRTIEKDFKRMCEVVGLPAGQPVQDLHARNAIPAKQEKKKLLTPKAEEKLRLFLEPDYVVMDKLTKKGLLTQSGGENENVVSEQQ